MKRNKFYFIWNQLWEKLMFLYEHRLRSLYKRTYHPLALKAQNIQYKTIPVIRGNFKFVNKGTCTIGENLVFNSSFRSNPAGLYKQCTIFVDKYAELNIDDNCGFSGVSIYCSKEISIGRNLFCGANVNIWDTDFHSLDYIKRREHDTDTIVSLPIKIGNDVFIGANSTILKGACIGDRSIIGAGSIVTKNIPPDEVWAGNPAKFVKKIS